MGVTMKIFHRWLTVVLTISVAASACSGNGGRSAESAVTLDAYLGSFGSDYEPARSFEELADRSALVIRAELVEVTDGRAFGDSLDDAARTARLTFRSTSGELVSFELPRPTNVSSERISELFTRSVKAVLYLNPVVPIPNEEAKLWHNLPDQPLWQLTTPQGFVFEVPGKGVTQLDAGGLAPASDPSVLDSYLPRGGERRG
jgi:hypothetical protein